MNVCCPVEIVYYGVAKNFLIMSAFQAENVFSRRLDKMKSTKEGKRFFLAAFMIALAAFNTGNNLIYLILSMMLAIFFLSIIVLKINMRKLVLKVHQDNPVYADTPASIAVTMANKKRIASRSVKVMSSGIDD